MPNNNAKAQKKGGKTVKKAAPPTKAQVIHATAKQVPQPVNRKKKEKIAIPSPQRHGKKVYQKIPVVYSTNQQDTAQQPCEFESTALKCALMSLISFLANKGALSNTTGTGLENPWDCIYGGINYILQGIASEIQGGTSKLTTYPRVIGDLIAALRPKVVAFMTFGNQSYSWNPFDAESILIESGINAPWYCTYVLPDDNPDSPYNLAGKWKGSSIPNEDLYSGLIRLLNGSKFHPMLEIVSADKYESQLKNDCSAFSRVYVYNGYQPTPTSGFWKDVENEVTITAPVYANFCKYATPDQRAPTKLTVFSGGPEMCVGGRVLFDNLSPFNKTPYVYKEIDFEEIYSVLVLWMAQAKELTIRNAIGNFDGSAAESLPFTMQDFRIALRQALMVRFPCQAVSQFTGVLGGISTNRFQPFTVMGSTCAHPRFGDFLIPTLLNENLAALEPRQLQYGGKKGSRQATVYIPIIGRREQDVPIIPQFLVNGSPRSLFLIEKQDPISLVDGEYGPNGDHVNLNSSYYQTIMDDWNFHVTRLSQVLCDVQEIKGDGGPPGLGALYMTRVIKTFVTEGASVPKVPMRYVESLKFVQNSGVPKVDKPADVPAFSAAAGKGGKPPMIKTASGNFIMVGDGLVRVPDGSPIQEVPPGSIIRNGVVVTTCNRKLLAEEEGLYDFLVLPSVRTSDTEDALNVQMYQTEVREPLFSFAGNRVTGTGADMYSRMQMFASLCVPGLGKNYSNLYTRTISHLQDLNRGGMLSGILAGVVGAAFPQVKDVANTVASFIPF